MLRPPSECFSHARMALVLKAHRRSRHQTEPHLSPRRTGSPRLASDNGDSFSAARPPQRAIGACRALDGPRGSSRRPERVEGRSGHRPIPPYSTPHRPPSDPARHFTAPDSARVGGWSACACCRCLSPNLPRPRAGRGEHLSRLPVAGSAKDRAAHTSPQRLGSLQPSVIFHPRKVLRSMIGSFHQYDCRAVI
jgi:hypothetical protein